MPPGRAPGVTPGAMPGASSGAASTFAGGSAFCSCACRVRDEASARVAASATALTPCFRLLATRFVSFCIFLHSRARTAAAGDQALRWIVGKDRCTEEHGGAGKDDGERRPVDLAVQRE